MATYKEIHGVNIQSRDSDATAVEGDVWYNASTSKLKMHTFAAGTWATGGNLVAAKQQGMGIGTQTAALIAGGNPALATNESYDGSSWSEIANINTGRRDGSGFGTQTAGSIVGGQSPTVAIQEAWDGSSWTEVGDLSTARHLLGASGTQTAAIAAGGEAPYKNLSEEFNGTAWTEGDNLPLAKSNGGFLGPQTAALFAGGNPGPAGQTNASYDGSSWTEQADLNSTRVGCGASLSGTNTSAIVFGGQPLPNVKTEEWDGSSWTEVNDLSTSGDFKNKTQEVH